MYQGHNPRLLRPCRCQHSTSERHPEQLGQVLQLDSLLVGQVVVGRGSQQELALRVEDARVTHLVTDQERRGRTEVSEVSRFGDELLRVY